MKKEKGITIISLVLTIVLMTIITTTAVYNSSEKIKITNLQKLYSDIENLQDKILIYYAKNKELPTTGDAITNIDFLKDNNGTNYYCIDLSKLSNISLTYGKDYENVKNGTGIINQDSDLYIINTQNQRIYYLKGVTYEGATVHTIA